GKGGGWRRERAKDLRPPPPGAHNPRLQRLGSGIGRYGDALQMAPQHLDRVEYGSEIKIRVSGVQGAENKKRAEALLGNQQVGAIEGKRAARIEREAQIL